MIKTVEWEILKGVLRLLSLLNCNDSRPDSGQSSYNMHTKIHKPPYFSKVLLFNCINR